VSIEICVQTMRGYDDTIAIARWCEVEGVSALAIADHYLSGPDTSSPGFEQLVILGGIARETSTLELSTLVSPLTFRHPAVHLKAAVTLDQMSGGRFSLGIGAGWMELEHESFGLELHPIGERFDRLEETLGYLRAGTDGSGTGFDGHYYRLAPFDPQPQATRLRLVVGGGGKRRTPELAGRFADEFNVFPSETPMAPRVEVCTVAAARAGRDPEAIRVSTAFPAAVGPDQATADAIVAARAERAKTDVSTLVSRFDDLGIPRGNPDQAAAAYSTLAAAGVTRVYLQLAANTLDEIAHAVAAARRAAELAG
jgi:alkanesulfonate monooxygenase SsuD/methylene tetrahydromethanopterin reductase-like flavin-dependent oxidoreductase (luciferase family)